ncbi:hypothetical protein F2P44_28265 [Massilia sp. CCM 8695]|uniref:DUF3757 domain-containing protein n=1 Tax=Massilia frigida TaxID=2609281 RepID=A0ABX0NDG1_9BURK|nr:MULTISPECIES: hypothetical protein [Massilia]MDM5178003.1 hypothetical protein [Massilia sp. DJPM01]NHZ83139.1 hypothetical protein [Massilia frigida]
MKKYFRAAAVLLVQLAALPAMAAPEISAPICEILASDAIATMIGMPVAGKESSKGMFSEACVFKTSAGKQGPSMFIIERYTKSLPAGAEKDMVMTTPTSQILAVEGLGDAAWMNSYTSELLVRRGGTVHKVIARAVECEKLAEETYDEQEVRCTAKRVGILKQTAAAILAR